MAGDVVCLYEESGLSAHDWAVAGYDVYCYDIENTDRIELVGKGRKIFKYWDARDKSLNEQLVKKHKGSTAIVLAFPPCDDLAIVGAQWFAKKEQQNPNYRSEAMALVYTAYDIAEALEAPYAIENPIGVISTEWRKPDYIWNPWEFGGYLPEDDIHPLYPKYIAPRDGYKKRTCFWTGGGFELPEKKPVEYQKHPGDQFDKLGGKRKKTKRIRNVSPRGMARAIFERYNNVIPGSEK